jgi:hypothetical protein
MAMEFPTKQAVASPSARPGARISASRRGRPGCRRATRRYAAPPVSLRTARPTAFRLGTVSSSSSRDTTMPAAPASEALITHW